MKGKWSPAHLAPEGVVVRTKIDDANGVRNEGDPSSPIPQPKRARAAAYSGSRLG